MSSRPLRVRAWLRTPIISDPYLPLDGILFYAANWRRYGFPLVSLPGGYIGVNQTRLPLEIVHAGKPNWYYRCSWAQWGPYVEGSSTWNKRFDLPLISLLAHSGKILTSKGAYKAYLVPVYYRAALWVEWYCVGRKEEIEELLCVMTNVGKKGAQGWGRVTRWEVEEIAEDWSIWKDGKLMRGIPLADLPAGFQARQAYWGLRPSYWHPDNQTWLAMP